MGVLLGGGAAWFMSRSGERLKIRMLPFPLGLKIQCPWGNRRERNCSCNFIRSQRLYWATTAVVAPVWVAIAAGSELRERGRVARTAQHHHNWPRSSIPLRRTP